MSERQECEKREEKEGGGLTAAVGSYAELVFLVNIPTLFCFASWKRGQTSWWKKEREGFALGWVPRESLNCCTCLARAAEVFLGCFCAGAGREETFLVGCGFGFGFGFDFGLEAKMASISDIEREV